MLMHNNQPAFSLVELLLVLAIVSVMLALAVPTWRQHQLAAGRQQAWLQLQDLALQQQMWHLQQGHYFADLDAVKPTLDQRRYRYQVNLTETGFSLSATINANGPQAYDTLCWQLTLADTGEVKSLGKGGQIQVCK
jgi:type IV pilus assembly protein PilE